MTIINIVIFISYYFLFLFSILGFGLLFCKFSNIFSNKINLGVIGLLGFCFLSFISYFTNLFFSHNFIHNIIIHSVGIISLFFFINKEKFYINENLKKLLLVSCLVISGLFISKNNEDFPYYHLSYVINLIDSNTIIGLGNLNSAYRTPSSLFYFNSLLYLPYIKYYLFHSSGIYILTFTNLFLLEIFFYLKKNNNFVVILSSLIFIFINTVFNRLAEYGTDRAGHIIVLIIFIYLFNILNSKKFEKNNIKIVTLLIIFIVTIKAYFIVYFSLFAFIIFNIVKFNKLEIIKKEFKFLIIILSFFLIFILINFLTSGCLIYPLRFSCFDKLLWAPTLDSIIGHGKWFELWAKAGATPNYRVADPENYVFFLNWVPNWINSYFFFKFTDTLLSIVIIIFIYLLIFFKNKNKTVTKKETKIKNFKSLYILVIILFFIWFFKHPDLRYGGYPLLALLFFMPVSKFFSKFKFKKIIVKKNFLIIIILVFLFYNFKNISRINSEFNRIDKYKYNNFPFFYIENTNYQKFIKENGIAIYEPINNNCWATPAPCAGRNTKVEKFLFFKVFYGK